MDQKKTLWIIAAVGAFLLVVLGAAWIFYTPKTYEASAATAKAVERTVNETDIRAPGGWDNSYNQMPVPPVPEYQNNQISADKVDVLASNASVYVVQNDSSDAKTIDLNELKNKSLDQTNPQTFNVTVNIDGKAVDEKNVSIEKKPAAPVEQSVKKVSAPAPVKKASEPVKKAPAPEVKKTTHYWVQVAAYSDKKHADNARNILDANKIPSDVFTFQDNKGKLFYRVRVGPYTTKSEAEYWRTRIIKIDDFAKAESYVTSTTN